MSPSTALLLARPAAAADRGRVWLIAAATAFAGALVLAAVRIARFSGGDDGDATLGALIATPRDGLARYITEDGLRPGVVVAVGLLVVPVLALAVQALRVGSTARDRRMASLRLAGATPREVRVVAAAEAGGAALVGGLAAGPAYLALWVVLGVLTPAGLELLPAPTPIDAAVWAGLVLLASLAGALAGAAVESRAVTEPLGVRRRAQSSKLGWGNLAALVVGLVMVISPVLGAFGQRDGDVSLFAMMAGVLLAAVAGGPRLVLLGGRALCVRSGAQRLLAGSRLRADPRSAGRAAGVLVLCGVALGVDAGLLIEYLGDRQDTDEAFYLTGYAFAALGVLVAATVALVTLLIGAADGLLDARRPLATLAAFGVGDAFLTRVLVLQLAAVAAPALVLGVLVGGVAPSLLFDGPSFGARSVRLTGLTAPAAAIAALIAARLTAWLLRSRVRAATAPENLRVA